MQNSNNNNKTIPTILAVNPKRLFFKQKQQQPQPIVRLQQRRQSTPSTYPQHFHNYELLRDDPTLSIYLLQPQQLKQNANNGPASRPATSQGHRTSSTPSSATIGKRRPTTANAALQVQGKVLNMIDGSKVETHAKQQQATSTTIATPTNHTSNHQNMPLRSPRHQQTILHVQQLSSSAMLPPVQQQQQQHVEEHVVAAEINGTVEQLAQVQNNAQPRRRKPNLKPPVPHFSQQGKMQAIVPTATGINTDASIPESTIKLQLKLNKRAILDHLHLYPKKVAQIPSLRTAQDASTAPITITPIYDKHDSNDMQPTNVSRQQHAASSINSNLQRQWHIQKLTDKTKWQDGNNDTNKNADSNNLGLPIVTAKRVSLSPPTTIAVPHHKKKKKLTSTTETENISLSAWED